MEVRSDVRARWASVATIDYATLAAGDGTVDLRALEGIVSRLAGMDKALTERARKESSFEATLAPLGPTRTLRALALAGPTLHVKLDDGTLKASVDLTDELLVAAFAERDGERYEAWTALARVLGLTDATVIVEHRAHPAAMNIMEPVDQALENAAQERARAPELFAAEERSQELSGLRRELHDHGTAASQAASASDSAQAISVQATTPLNGAKSMPPRARTLIGVAPVAPLASSTPGARPSARTADHFADVPTNPVAPGLLQSMAQQAPANDSRAPAPKAPAALHAAPVAAPAPSGRSQHEDDDFGDGEQEYDAGEVTVVADASQLDILRETLGRLDEPQKPLTSTMPAPPKPGDEDEVSDSIRPGADEPVLELSTPHKSAVESVFGADEMPSTENPSEPPSALSAPPKPQPVSAPSLSQPAKLEKPAPTGSRMWLVAVLLVLAALAIFALYRTQG